MNATPTRPTSEQIQRVLDILAAGLDVDDAIEAVWDDVPPPKASPKPTVMVTEFPDGVVIGWDHCARCNKTVKTCACKEGPQELRVFEQWRTGTKVMPNYGASSSAPPAATTSVAASPGKAPAVHPDGQVVCREHNDFVDQTEASKNDDGSWTCFVCQESGVQVSRD